MARYGCCSGDCLLALLKSACDAVSELLGQSFEEEQPPQGEPGSVPESRQEDVSPRLLGRRGGSHSPKPGAALELPEEAAPPAVANEPQPAAPELPEPLPPAVAFQLGDIVKLTTGEYRGRTAMITELFEQHCTVVVLEENRFVASQQWPFLRDLELLDTKCRLGTRVVLHGFAEDGPRANNNGRRGTVREEPSRKVHPSLVVEGTNGPKKVAVVVRLDRLPGQRGPRDDALVAPKFFSKLEAEGALHPSLRAA